MLEETYLKNSLINSTSINRYLRISWKETKELEEEIYKAIYLRERFVKKYFTQHNKAGTEIA